jgi:hypothetical protein
MKWAVAFAAALAVSGCAQNKSAQSDFSSTKPWFSTLDEKCRRCVPSKYVLVKLPVQLPKRAVLYGFTGEFANKSDTWIVNLDTGEVILCEGVSNGAGEWKDTASHLGTVDRSALEKLRASTANLWKSEPYNILGWDSPGAVEVDEVVSGSQLVAFSRFAPNDRDIVAAINSALPAGAARTNGSFVVRAPKQ